MLKLILGKDRDSAYAGQPVVIKAAKMTNNNNPFVNFSSILLFIFLCRPFPDGRTPPGQFRNVSSTQQTTAVFLSVDEYPSASKAPLDRKWWSKATSDYD